MVDETKIDIIICRQPNEFIHKSWLHCFLFCSEKYIWINWFNQFYPHKIVMCMYIKLIMFHQYEVHLRVSIKIIILFIRIKYINFKVINLD